MNWKYEHGQHIRIWKKAIVTTFKALSWHLSGQNEESNVKLRKVSNWAMIKPIYLPNGSLGCSSCTVLIHHNWRDMRKP